MRNASFMEKKKHQIEPIIVVAAIPVNSSRYKYEARMTFHKKNDISQKKKESLSQSHKTNFRFLNPMKIFNLLKTKKNIYGHPLPLT